MAHIHEVLENIRQEDQQKFINIRTNMRKAYLMAISSSVGINNYNAEDDTFFDALDIKVEMLMHRAGIETPSNENRIAETNVSDPFALMTRIPILSKDKLPENRLENNSIKKSNDDKDFLNAN